MSVDKIDTEVRVYGINLGVVRVLAMKGTILQVSVSPGGIPKRAAAAGIVGHQGLEGDSWAHPQFHGGPDQALLLITEEVIEKLKAHGFPLFPGALGENLTTQGLDAAKWRFGQIFRAGSARLQITRLRTPCRTLKVYGQDIGRAIFDSRAKNGDPNSPVWGYSGVYAKVLTEGVVRPGDLIELESEVA
jgi:MOSC domain-containing protein YiiM